MGLGRGEMCLWDGHPRVISPKKGLVVVRRLKYSLVELEVSIQ
jgi:hypothetical protein